MILHQIAQIRGISALAQPIDCAFQSAGPNKTTAPGNFFGTCDFHPLPFFERGHEFCRHDAKNSIKDKDGQDLVNRLGKFDTPLKTTFRHTVNGRNGIIITELPQLPPCVGVGSG